MIRTVGLVHSRVCSMLLLIEETLEVAPTTFLRRTHYYFTLSWLRGRNMIPETAHLGIFHLTYAYSHMPVKLHN